MAIQNDVRVSWTPAPNPPSPIVKTRVYARLNQTGNYDTLLGEVGAGITQIDLPDLVPGKYNFAVRGVDAFDQEGALSTGSNLIEVLAAPAVPLPATGVGAVFI